MGSDDDELGCQQPLLSCDPSPGKVCFLRSCRRTGEVLLHELVWQAHGDTLSAGPRIPQVGRECAKSARQCEAGAEGLLEAVTGGVFGEGKQIGWAG